VSPQNELTGLFVKNYEARIDALQKQVEEQSMTMSMYSSYTPEDFNNDEDIFGEFCRVGSLLWLNFDQAHVSCLL
jgi:hypothetical protein